ncbi:semaphorin-5A-like [Ctenocephalides felis]|uniref:semaphorin-5A-like n=1 Tax=Ctenocephalides felis TaxID=7515 RepID=UPI000E6E1538|nr:semaphorin-5A-like [Ctenocephalides felis]
MARPLGLSKILLFYISLLNICLISAIDENDFRYILFKDIHKESHRFSQHEIVDYSKILFDHTRDQIIVGASDYLLRLSLSNLSLIESTWIPPTEIATKSCLDKGQSEAFCKNHFRVLLELENEDSILVCGTNAFFPQCCVRKITDLKQLDNVPGPSEFALIPLWPTRLPF